jgi:predicted deacylase
MLELILSALTLVADPGTAHAPTAPFAIAGVEVTPGSRFDVDVPVTAGSDPATSIPITVFHGSRPGRVLAITAGVHGYEFPPILAGQALLERIDPKQLTGTVILVRLASVNAFDERTPYVNPVDRKNLNRVFPGRADGTQTERIAWTITTEVIRRSDVHMELHSGDGAEWLEEFVGVYGGPLSTDYDTARAMAVAFGFKNLVRYSMDTQQQIDSGRSLNRQAVADKKPTILVEIGENGRTDAAFVSAIVDGVLNAMRALKMLPGAVTAPRQSARWFDSTTSASATRGGILTPASTSARMIRKGELLGTIRDFRGNVIEEVRSPIDGYALYGLAGPPVKPGDPVVTIAIPAKGPL